MKKYYTAPVVEKIEFDYSETVTASGKQTYRDSNENYECHSSLMPDNPCGYELSGRVHTSNANYDCKG